MATAFVILATLALLAPTVHATSFLIDDIIAPPVNRSVLWASGARSTRRLGLPESSASAGALNRKP
jgi:hypothetical protein